MDEYIQPLNAFVPAGSLATGIPAVKFPDLCIGRARHPEYHLDQFAAARQTSAAATSNRTTSPSQRDLGAGFVIQTGYVGTHSIRQAVTYFEFNAGLIPGAGVNGRPLYRQVRRERQPQLLHPDGEPTLRLVADQPDAALLARSVPHVVVHLVEGHRHQRGQQRQRPALLRSEPVLEEQIGSRFRPDAFVVSAANWEAAVRQGQEVRDAGPGRGCRWADGS